ncbi:MAG TPA: sialidase family protein [Gaiellaceae bacterium]
MKVLRTPLRRRLTLALALAATAALVTALGAGASVPLQQIAVDTFTNPDSQHATIVEPDTFASGNTIVAVAQFGRFFDGGASDIGWATSQDGGATWPSSGGLPGLTVNSVPAGPYARVSDPSVAYDAMHHVWIVSSLALDASVNGVAVVASRSTDATGTAWLGPVTIASIGPSQSFDKNWTVCDNTPTSSFYGSCYTQFDDFGHGNALKIYYSRNGGASWTASRVPNVGVIGGQPVVRDNGTVVVPIDNASETALGYTISTNGGVKFGQAFTITNITAANDPGGIRSGPLPSAEISGDNKIYVVWEDCRFRAGCTTNDLVYVTSTNGSTWSAVQRIPIDPVSSTVDHLIPGVAVDRSTSGANIHVGVAYYYYPNVNCNQATCDLNAGFISSVNGGTGWSTPQQLGPTPAGTLTMKLGWLPDTSQGRMVGDYISTSYAGGTAHPAVAFANPPPSGTCGLGLVCDQALYTTTSGLAAAGGSITANDQVVYNGPSLNGNSAFRRAH